MSADSRAPGQQRPSFKRRTYLLDRDFQLKYSLMLALVGAGSIALFGALAYAVHRSEPGGGGGTLLWLTAVGTLGMGAVFALFGVVLTHRVAGPVHVMNLHLAALASGRYPRLRQLRKNDELRRFFDRFADAVERIRARESDEAQVLDHVLATLRPLATTPAAQEALGALASLHARKQQAIDAARPVALPPAA